MVFGPSGRVGFVLGGLAVNVVALYVSADGVYPSLGLAAWFDVERDGRSYWGPWPVVAHPPCAGWGRYRQIRRSLHRANAWDSVRLDADARAMSCRPIAVEQVREFGGVLEHPAESFLWACAGLPLPGRADRWGRSYMVYQGAYGHPCPKATWLYVCGHAGPLTFASGDGGASGLVTRQWSVERDRTPVAFAAVLVDIASKCVHGAGPFLDVGLFGRC